MICSQWTHTGFLTIIFCFSYSWNTCLLVWKSFPLLEEMEIFIILSALCLPIKKRDHWKCFEKSERFHKCSLLSKSLMSVISMQTTNSGRVHGHRAAPGLQRNTVSVQPSTPSPEYRVSSSGLLPSLPFLLEAALLELFSALLSFI